MAQRNIPTLADIRLDTNLFDFRPFQGCDNCDGLCWVLTTKTSFSRLLNQQPITLFHGQKLQLWDWAMRGCSFARLLCGPVERLAGFPDTVGFELSRAARPWGLPPHLQLLIVQDDRSTASFSLSFYLEIVTGPDDPAASFLGARPVNPDPASPRNLIVVSEWLTHCTTQRKGHERCPKWELINSKLPTRVISVALPDGLPRLYIPEKEEVGRYAALSYCWGGPQPHRTTVANLSEYTRGLPMQQLPATILDAIALTRSLLIPYLWVDSLCIIQDLEEDKIREIATMAQVYKNSWVTFSAARASACNEGILGIQEDTAARLSKSSTIPVTCPNDSLGSAMLYPARFQMAPKWYSREGKVPVNNRAWTYQETLLAPRVVSYYHDAIEFKCLAGLHSNDGLKAEELDEIKPADQRQAKLDSVFFLDSKDGLSAAEFPNLEVLWSRVVKEYSFGRLSYPDDKLPAVSAIASEFQRLSGDTYLAGLWRRSLVRELQWKKSSWRSGTIESTTAPRRAYRIPTWSWASIDGRISNETSQHLISDRVEVLDCRVNPVSEQAPFGHVDGGYVAIRGPVKCVDLKDAWDNFGLGQEHQRPYESRKIGLFSADFRWDISADAEDFRRHWGIPPDRGPLWLLGLSMRPRDSYETCGLILLETSDNRYERAGLFYIGSEYYGGKHSDVGRFADHWGDDYEVRAVTIC